MADAGSALEPAEVTQATCPRCWFPAPMAPLAALTFRCARCEWPFTFGSSTAPSDAVPASGAAYVNACGSPCSVTLSGGTTSAVSIGGAAQGLAAPAAPVPAATGADGSMTAGVYQVEVSYVTADGETLASPAGSATIAGSNHLAIPSPAAAAGATGWYAYVTVHDGATFCRQQTAGSPTAIGTALTLTANPGTSGANPPAVNTTFGTMFVPAAASVTLTYSSTAPAWTWALLQTSGAAAAGDTALAFTAGGTAFTAGQVLIIDPAGTSDVVVVNGTPTATSVPVNSVNSAHSSGVTVTVAQLTPALSGAGLENVPATSY